MKFGICNINSVAIRKEPCNTSEMVSQLLFGETFTIIEFSKKWVNILTAFDKYEGWVLSNQFLQLDELQYDDINTNNSYFSNELVTFISNQNTNLQILTLGSSLPFYKNNSFKLLDKMFEYDGESRSGKSIKSELVKTAQLYLNTPFLWGGRTPFGIDCSGFTQMVYKLNGYSLFRDANLQATQGEVLSFIEESEAGDLAFFDNEEGEIDHVGIILANNHIIHCYGKVRIDRLDQSGIYNADVNRHTHKLRVMKKMF